MVAFLRKMARASLKKGFSSNSNLSCMFWEYSFCNLEMHSRSIAGGLVCSIIVSKLLRMALRSSPCVPKSRGLTWAHSHRWSSLQALSIISSVTGFWKPGR